MDHQMTMGDLPGHIYPGLAYVFWGVAWAVWLLRRGGNVASHPWSAQPDAGLAEAPAAMASWESWVKIVIPLVEMAGELRWVTWPMTDESATIYAHILADVAVILSGVADRLTARKVLPPASDRMALALAFFVPSFLFAMHGQHGPVATAAHRLFAGTLFAVGALVLLQHVRPAPIFLWLRTYAAILAGAWFLQTGWMLYVAGYDLMSEGVAVRGYLFFTLYAVGLAMLLAAALAARRRA